MIITARRAAWISRTSLLRSLSSTTSGPPSSTSGNKSKVEYKLEDPDILFQSNHVLVVNKRAGIPSQPDSSGAPDMAKYIKNYLKIKFRKRGEVYLGSFQRLDRAASGALCFAKTSRAASRMSRAFQMGHVEKEYLAIVEGDLIGRGKFLGGQTSYAAYWERRGNHVDWQDRQHGDKRLQKPDGDLEWTSCGQVVAYTSEEAKVFTLVAVKIATGRKHQIRRQLAMLGHPIVGDTLYGSKTRIKPYGPFEFNPILLHATALKFANPVVTDKQGVAKSKNRSLVTTKDTISVFCQPPRFWRLALKDLSFPTLRPGQTYFDLGVELHEEQINYEREEMEQETER